MDDNDDIKRKTLKLKNLENENISRKEKEEILEKLSNDKHYQVRKEVVLKLDIYPIKSIIDKLIKDPIPIVRIALINATFNIRKSMNSDFILDKLLDVIVDTDSKVRIALANVIHHHVFLTDDSKQLKPANDETQLETFVRIKLNERFLLGGLLLDPIDDVRMAAADNFRYFATKLSFDFIYLSLFDSIHLMMTDPQWRIRITSAELIYGFSMLSTIDFFEEYLYQFILRFLTDSCKKVRDYAIFGLPVIVEKFCYDMNENDGKAPNPIKKNEKIELGKMKNVNWFINTFLKRLEMSLINEDNLIYKQTFLLCLFELSDYIPLKFQRKVLFLPILKILKNTDECNNVIILALDILIELKDWIHPFQKKYEITPIANALSSNPYALIREHAKFLLEDTKE